MPSEETGKTFYRFGWLTSVGSKEPYPPHPAFILWNRAQRQAPNRCAALGFIFEVRKALKKHSRIRVIPMVRLLDWNREP